MIAALNQFSFAQGSNWKIDGNSNASSTTFLGSTTNQPLIFKTNSLERMRITGSGGFVFQGLGASLGFLTTDASGNLQKTAFPGNVNQVLLGNGTFGAVPTLASYFTLSSPTQITTSYKLGIGVSSPAEMLEVNGNGVFNGSLTAQGLNITDVTYAGKALFYRNNGMCMDGFDAIAGTQNEICAMNAPLFINSKPTFAFNTYLNASNSGKVGIGTTNPQGKLDVDGDTYLRSNTFLTNVPIATNSNELLSYDPLNGQIQKTTIKSLTKSIYEIATDLNYCPAPGSNPIWSNGPNKIYVACPDVKVGIGTVNPSHSLTVNGNATVGIGTADPNQTFSVLGSAQITSHTWSRTLSVGADASSFAQFYVKNDSRGASIEINNNGHNDPYTKLVYAEYDNPTTEFFKIQNTALDYTAFLMQADGNFYINNGTQKILQLDSVGLLRARRIKVDVVAWPDFVFEKDYELMPLNELQQFITKENHLPGVSSASDMETNGQDLGETNKMLMQKIEELTLYLLQQEKRILELEKSNTK